VRRSVLVVIGIVVALAGAVFTLQGFGVLGGSPMTGSMLWAILGPIIALLGILLVIYGLRSARRS